MIKIKRYLPSIFSGLLFGFLFQIGFNDCRAWIAIIFEFGLIISLSINSEERKDREK